MTLTAENVFAIREAAAQHCAVVASARRALAVARRDLAAVAAGLCGSDDEVAADVVAGFGFDDADYFEGVAGAAVDAVSGSPVGDGGVEGADVLSGFADEAVARHPSGSYTRSPFGAGWDGAAASGDDAAGRAGTGHGGVR